MVAKRYVLKTVQTTRVVKTHIPDLNHVSMSRTLCGRLRAHSVVTSPEEASCASCNSLYYRGFTTHG